MEEKVELAGLVIETEFLPMITYLMEKNAAILIVLTN